MNKVFCSSCGHKNVYEVTKPKFCADCGAPIGSPSIASTKKVVAEIDYEEEQPREFDLSRLKNDIVAEVGDNQGTTLTDLWKSATPDSANRFDRPAPNLPDGEAMIKQSQADCSSSRVQDIDG